MTKVDIKEQYHENWSCVAFSPDICNCGRYRSFQGRYFHGLREIFFMDYREFSI